MAYVLVSIIMLLAVIVVIFFLQFFDVGIFFKIKSSDENINNILIISFILAAVNFVLALVNNILLASQESSKVNFFSLFGQLFFIIGLLIYRKYGVSLILLVTFAEGFSQFIKNIIETIYVFNKYPELKPKKSNVDFYYSKGIMSFGIKCLFYRFQH